MLWRKYMGGDKLCDQLYPKKQGVVTHQGGDYTNKLTVLNFLGIPICLPGVISACAESTLLRIKCDLNVQYRAK